MVPAVGLVEHGVQQVDGRALQVDVDADRGTQAAGVLVEGHPGLAPHVLHVEALAVRQPEQPPGLAAGLLDHGVDQRGDAVTPGPASPAPSPGSAREWALARKQLLELVVRRVQGRLVGAGGFDAEAGGDLVAVAPALAGDHPRAGAKAGDLVAEPPVVELVEQSVTLGHQLGRRGRLLAVDASGQVGRPVVGLDHSLVVAGQAEGKQDVALAELGIALAHSRPD